MIATDVTPIKQAAREALALMLEAEAPMPAFAAIDRVKEAGGEVAEDLNVADCVWELFLAAAHHCSELLGERPRSPVYPADYDSNVLSTATILSTLQGAWDIANEVRDAIRGNYRPNGIRLSIYLEQMARIPRFGERSEISPLVERLTAWPKHVERVDAILAALEEVEGWS